MNSKYLIITILTALVVGSAGFFGGMKYQQSKNSKILTPTGRAGNFNNGQARSSNNGPSRFNGQQGLGGVAGEIISMDDKTITVKAPDGTSKIVILSDSASINKAVEGTKDDLKVGENVRVFGSTNSDGSVTAQNIQINPTNQGQVNNNQSQGQ